MGFNTGNQRECTVFQLHNDALQRVLSLLVRNFEQLQNNGLILAQHFAGCDTEQQGVTNLTCGAGDGNSDGLLAHGENSRFRK